MVHAWTEVNNLNTAQICQANSDGIGTYTSALAYRRTTTLQHSCQTESWNGSSWTEVGDLNTSKRIFGWI